MRAFVTGATGLLGNNLVRALLAAGHPVTGLARDAAKAQALLADTGATIATGDMRDVAGFAAALAGCDVVFHTAAYFREAFGRGEHEAALERINHEGTLALLEAADRAGARAFVHVSSGGIIGKKADGSPGDEDTPPLPIQIANAYFRSKLRTDAALAQWHGTSGIRIVEVLPGWIWGPYDAAPTAAGQLIDEFTAGRVPAVIDGGTMIVDARDVAAAMIEAGRRAPDRARYIVGGTFQTMQEILAALQRATGIGAPRIRIPHLALLAYAAAAEAWGRWTGSDVLITRTAVRTMHEKIMLDSSRAIRELGIVFRPFDETIGDSCRWRRQWLDRRSAA
ncbi:MAG TPA: NAD-dependent epimerase/dehydratase family protein [Candidatus Limnocylindrales bacterium]|nr:NAD-dependent epimerase/dehydratase family protein [Candidatus Limnocylindrales bacterium]